jgi:hypothetical protein
MSQLWITDPTIWHWSVRRLGPLRYRAACGVELDARIAHYWPLKPGELGPPSEDRCQLCLAESLVALPIPGAKQQWMR